MYLSSRVKNVAESITLKLNDKVSRMAEAGQTVFNLTAGQLPFRPLPEFVDKISGQLNFLKSYQYSPVAGFPELRKKIMEHVERVRGVSFQNLSTSFDCIVSNGAKHTLYNILGAIIDPGDEVIVLTPYWVSYPEMVKFWGGTPHFIKTNPYDAFTPPLDEIRRSITPRTKAIIINSPNNPAGISYSDEWMNNFAELMEEFPELLVISDEIYFELFYYDPRPTYFYQKRQHLLERTIIVDGISKSFACTGLRIGFCVAPTVLIQAIAKIQAQTTSGANSLIQRSLVEFDFVKISEFVIPVQSFLRRSSEIIREEFRLKNLDNCWYQTTAAFYYMVDFTQTPVFKQFTQDKDVDCSMLICEKILEKTSVAIVPGTDFGLPNSARLSMVISETHFQEAIRRLSSFLAAE